MKTGLLILQLFLLAIVLQDDHANPKERHLETLCRTVLAGPVQPGILQRVASRICQSRFAALQQIGRKLLRHDLIGYDKREAAAYAAYRELVNAGPQGWSIIARYTCDNAPRSDFFRRPIEISLCRDLDGFCRYMQAHNVLQVEDERWMRRHAEAWVRSLRRYSSGEFRDLIKEIEKSRSDPSNARAAIANLRALCATNLAFPWHGSTTQQLAAIDDILKFWAGNSGRFLDDEPAPSEVNELR